MAVNEGGGRQGTFVKIANGQMYYNTDVNDTAATPNEYIKNKGKDNEEKIITYRHYLGKYGSIDGRIISGGFKELTFGTIFEIALQDADGDIAMLQLSPGTGMLNFFVNQLKKIDFNKKVILSANTGKDGKGSTVYISQEVEGEEKPKWVGILHSKANPNGQPEMGEKKNDVGKKVADFSPINIFFAEWINNELQKMIDLSNDVEVKEVDTSRKPHQESGVIENKPVDNVIVSEESRESEDDLPF